MKWHSANCHPHATPCDVVQAVFAVAVTHGAAAEEEEEEKHAVIVVATLAVLKKASGKR